MKVRSGSPICTYLSTMSPKSLDFSMQNLKVLNIASIPQILKISTVESTSLDDSTVGFIYLGLSTVESESLDFSIEKWDIKKFSLIPQTISILCVMKKNSILVWWIRNHLILVRSGLFTSARVRWSLNHWIPVFKTWKDWIEHRFLKQFQFCVWWNKNLNLVWWSRNHLMIVRSGSPTSAWIRWSLNLLISIEICDIKKTILIPQTISILYKIKKILDFSMVGSKSLDFSTIGFTYLGLSTVESESLVFSIEKCEI